MKINTSTIGFGNKDNIDFNISGKLKLKITNSNGIENIMTLNDVTYVPGLE